MTKKMLFAIFGLLLAASMSFAQVSPRENANFADGGGNVTSVTNLSIEGVDNSGNVGYIQLRGSNGNGSIYYYLWVDCTGDLRISSRTTISSYSSFPSGDWRQPACGGGFSDGSTVVGSQS